jgi:RNA polymerase sigma-70 factor (ECF subfamily)
LTNLSDISLISLLACGFGHNFRPRSNMSMMPMRDLSSCSDEQLLQFGSEDVRALAEFYDRYEDHLLAFFRRATGRSDLAADLTGEVFAAALGSVAQFQPQLGSARGWLFGIARHELYRTWRRRRVETEARRRVGMEPVTLGEDDLQRIEELVSQDGVALAMLQELPGDQRDAVVGRVLEEREYADLARELECSEMILRKRVSRGLGALRSMMGEAR